MGGWLKSIFKGKIDLDNAFNRIANGVDKLAFTSEEKADFNFQMANAMAEFAKSTLTENTERSKTRRFIAKFSIINIFAMIWLLIVMRLLGHDITGIVEILGLFNIGIVFITINAFHFGGYYMSRYQEGKKKE